MVDGSITHRWMVTGVTLVAILPGMGMGLAAATLVGQALGRGDVDDAHRWGWDVTRTATVLMTVLGHRYPRLEVPVRYSHVL